MDSRSLAGLAIEIEAATQAIRHDIVDNMQVEAGAALVAARREEWIKRLTPDIDTHSAAIVGKENFDIVIPRRPDFDIDRASGAVGKRMGNRVEEEIGQHLPVWPGIAVHRHIGLALDKDQILFSQAQPQTHGHLPCQVAEIEDALVGVILVGCNLLERLDQFSRMFKIGDQLR
jgi:hypothetical protein